MRHERDDRRRQDRCERRRNSDVYRLIDGDTRAGETVIDDRDHDDAAADSDQPREQPGAGTGHRPQQNQPEGAHRGQFSSQARARVSRVALGTEFGIGPRRVFAAASGGCQRPPRQAPQPAAKVQRHVAHRLGAGTTGGHQPFRARPIQCREFVACPGRLVADLGLHLRPPEQRRLSDRKNSVEDVPSPVGMRSFVVKHRPCLVGNWCTHIGARAPILAGRITRVSGISHTTTREGMVVLSELDWARASHALLEREPLARS